MCVPLLCCGPDPLDRIRFIADVNVLKLGRLLILLGFDVACSASFFR
jgi:uncharacterized protein